METQQDIGNLPNDFQEFYFWLTKIVNATIQPNNVWALSIYGQINDKSGYSFEYCETKDLYKIYKREYEKDKTRR